MLCLLLCLISCLNFVPLVHLTSPQAEKLILQNTCVSKTTCHDCIQTPTCAWCYQPDFSADRKRCFQPSSLTTLNPICPDQYTWNPFSEKKVILQRELSRAQTAIASGHGAEYWRLTESNRSSKSKSYQSKSSYKGTSSSRQHYQSDIVQVSPQRLQLKLRAKETYQLQMYYTQAEDYPVDLYYLMDLSKSMEDDKDKLSTLGDLLAESMRNITSNFRLGFGSFVDKVVMPYVSTVPKQLKEPCTGCAAPYGFQNVMSLSQNTEKFSKMVKEASVSGNLDAPEGSFDAMMQAVVCRKEIGWREKARRLLVLSTDAGFHYAGDGKLGGIVTPNDGHCHLDIGGMYTHSSTLDYPSISQVNLKVKENAINVIFAVTEEKIKIYKQLQNHIEGSSCGKLSKDSSNIVDLVKEQYQQISSSIEMKDNASSAISVTYYSQCLDSTSPLKKTSRCENVKVGDVITFKIELEVLYCPKDAKDWKQTFQIYPVGLNESLVIDLEMLCDCPCERPENKDYIKHSPECNGVGTLKCGICDCDIHHFGRKCECSSSHAIDKESNQGCRADNTTFVDCSGRGNCVCGQCECETRTNEEEVISGNFCECDNFSCDRRNGLLCSGPDHGTCVCGQCQCNPLFGGSACDCLISNQTCIAPGSDDICSGHGQCICGQCKCDKTDDGKYTGMFCDKCPTCPGRCQEFKECVQCKMYKTGPLKNEQDCSTNCTITPVPVDQVEVDEEKGESLCAYYDEDDCRFAYVYTYDDQNKIAIRAQKERECPPKLFMLGFMLFVVSGVLIAGMAVLLLWKVLTTIHDRREFARFEKERMMAKWDTGENPIYKQATSTFKNPTYTGRL